MVGGHRADFAHLHHFGAADRSGVAKAVGIPELKQGQVQANVGGPQAVIFGEPDHDRVEVANVFHNVPSGLAYVTQVLPQQLHNFIMRIEVHAADFSIGQGAVDA